MSVVVKAVGLLAGRVSVEHLAEVHGIRIAGVDDHAEAESQRLAGLDGEAAVA